MQLQIVMSMEYLAIVPLAFVKNMLLPPKLPTAVAVLIVNALKVNMLQDFSGQTVLIVLSFLGAVLLVNFIRDAPCVNQAWFL
ncbi:MAG: hypothetical protein ACQUHE_17645 [Bacteroidia bacterium]